MLISSPVGMAKINIFLNHILVMLASLSAPTTVSTSAPTQCLVQTGSCAC